MNRNDERVMIVCGGRYLSDTSARRDALKKEILAFQPTVIFHGGCRGADALAGSVAREMGIPVRVFEPDWRGLGRRAGPVRNMTMAVTARDIAAAAAVRLCAFPGGPGTLSMTRICEDLHIPVAELA
jgi:hypothetical protein